MDRQELYDLILKNFDAKPEFLWQKFPQFCIFRHKDNKKWFAILMNVSAKKLGLKGEDDKLVLNVKIEEKDLFFLTDSHILPAYHLNKKNWITIVIDEKIQADLVLNLLNRSFILTDKVYKKREVRNYSVSWVVPVSLKYYDFDIIENCSSITHL